MTSGRPHIAKSAQKGDFETPKPIFDEYDQRYGPFDMDAAAAVGQYSADTILGRGGKIAIKDPFPDGAGPGNPNILYDAFEHPWHGKVWLNPPYGPISLLTAFVAKAVHEVYYENAELVCALLPARTGTPWWQEYVCQGAEFARISPFTSTPDTYHQALSRVHFRRGRITFVGAKNQAPFASAVVVWSAP